MIAERASWAGRSARVVPLCAVVLVASAWSGCAHRGFEVDASSASATTAEAALAGRQVLLRARYRGVDGRGRLRLTLRRMVDGSFRLNAADVMGRPLWSFGSSAGESLLIDHRRHEYCLLAGDVVVRAIALSELPVSTLSRVLLGELPFVDGGVGDSGEMDVVDGAGRRWTAKRGDDGHPVTWTLWDEDQPLVWWQKTGDGAILSHRGGAQVTWTLIADEPLKVRLPILEVPTDYQVGQCDDPDLS